VKSIYRVQDLHVKFEDSLYDSMFDRVLLSMQWEVEYLIFEGFHTLEIENFWRLRV
jgi:hypothetical protein